MTLPGLNGIAHYAPDHAEHPAGRAVIDGFEGDLIPAGHVSGQGAKLTVPRRRFPGRRGGSAWPRVTPVFVAAARPAWVLVPQTCAVLLPSAWCPAPGRFAPPKAIQSRAGVELLM